MLLALAAIVSVVAAPDDTDLPTLPLDLQWEAPASCSTRARAIDDIERLTGTTVVEDAPSQTFVRIAAVEAGYELTLIRRGNDGEVAEQRTLEAPECEVLARAATLMVAVNAAPLRLSVRLDETMATPPSPMAVATHRDEDDGSRPLDGDFETEPRPPVQPAIVERPSASVEPPPRRPAPTSTRRWSHRFVAGGTVGLAVGVAPGPAPVFGGWGGYALGPLRVELSGEHTLARTVSIEDGVAVRASSSGGGALVVYAPRIGGVRLLVGAGFRAGVLRGNGTGARVAERDAVDWWGAVPAIAGISWPADSRIALRAQVELSIATRRPAIAVGSPNGDLGGFRRPPAAFYVRIGPEIRLP